jgi:predicted kinase
MGRLIILIGRAKSGKSTWARNSFLENKVIVCADEIRLSLHGQRFLAEKEKEVHKITEVMVKTLFKQDLKIIIDETNTTISSIRKWLRIDSAAEIVYIDTPPEICKQNALNFGHDDLVNKGVIDRMGDNLVKLAKFGGFKDGLTSQHNILRAVEKIREEVIKEKESVVKS